MTQKLRNLVTSGVVVIGFVIVIGCGGKTSDRQAQATPAPVKSSGSDLEKLRWIEGTWRGTGGGEKPFFERYHFENATTLASDSFADEKLEKVTDTTLFELKDGEFGGGNEGSRWVATALDDHSITFAPAVKARNSFIWRRDSKDSWTAILSWPAKGDKPAGELTYKMERIK